MKVVGQQTIMVPVHRIHILVMVEHVLYLQRWVALEGGWILRPCTGRVPVTFKKYGTRVPGYEYYYVVLCIPTRYRYALDLCI